jgi:hypothetical protein
MTAFLILTAELTAVVVIVAIISRLIFGKRNRLFILGILLSVLRVGSLLFWQYHI